MDAVLQAIAESKRRAILQLVATQELSAGEIAGHFSISRPAVSQHLSILKEAGLLNERREGTKRFYQTRAEGLNEVRTFLESFWDSRLLRLKDVAESETKARRN
jgi:DNA-binding transcriptional ArsR family regulator